MAENKDRFVCVYKQGLMAESKILVDKLTGVHYLFHAVGHSGGMTVLLDENGKPVIDKSVLNKHK